jgi:fructose-specific phosphotransferase system IIC component
LPSRLIQICEVKTAVSFSIEKTCCAPFGNVFVIVSIALYVLMLFLLVFFVSRWLSRSRFVVIKEETENAVKSNVKPLSARLHGAAVDQNTQHAANISELSYILGSDKNGAPRC